MNQRLTDIRRAQLDQLLSGGTNMAGGGLLKAVALKAAAKAAKPATKAVTKVVEAAPQAEALRLAQQRAALPPAKGGLGLAASNTAEQRAAAMGGKDMVHFSRAGGDYTTLDSGKFAIAPFDAVGTHVGTPQAAMERFQNTVGYKVNNPNYANDELRGASYPVTILGDRPLMNQNGMPFGEDDLNALLRQQGGHNWSDLQGGKMTYQDMNANLRKKLFEDQGYTSIPYFNEVEGKGSISYIVPPENIRSRFAAFDPFRKTAATAAAMGVAAPDLLAKDKKEKKKAQGGLIHLAGGGDPRKRGLFPKMSTQAIVDSPGFDPEVPSDLSRAYARRMAEKEAYQRSMADQKLTPANRAVAGAEATGMLGSALFEGVQQLPKLLDGEEAYTKAVGEGMYQPRFQPEKAAEYAGNVGDFLEKLETEYKMPALTPELMPFIGAAEAAKQQSKRAVKQGALTAASRMDAGPKAGSMAAQRGAVKLGGGNWVDTEVKRSLGKLKQDDSYPESFIKSVKEDLAGYEGQPQYADDADRMRRDLAHMEQTNAFNKWVDTKAGSYVRNQMATPDDPVVKMLDVRAAKIEADYQAGQKRLAKLDERIAQAPTSTQEEQNTLANLKRTRSQRAAEIESDRELAMNSMLPGGKDNAGYEYLNNDIDRIKEKREKAGFLAEGYAQSEPAKAWEAAQDINMVIKPAAQFQNQEKKLAALQAAEKELKQYENVELSEKFKKYLEGSGFDEATKQRLFQGSPKSLIVDMIGDNEKSNLLIENYNEARNKVNASLASVAEENPYLTKLPPNTPVYRSYLPDLGIDHIIDVLKDDVATGKLKLEDLNKITMDQAVKRAAEYDFEMAKKARDAVAQSRATMPVYKEYPEGYKWVQLTKPGEFNAESNAMGHSVRGYEPEKGHPDWTPESGDSGSEYYGHGGWEAIKSGEAKVYSLIDPSGKPHTTIEVKANPNSYPVSGEAFAILSPEKRTQFREHVMQWRRRNPDVEELTDENVTQALKEAGVPPQPDIITQIKGKGNARPSEKYDQYTQDFVRSGNWDEVGNLKNTGLKTINEAFPNYEDAKRYGKSNPNAKYLTQAEIDAHNKEVNEELLNEFGRHRIKPDPESKKTLGKTDFMTVRELAELEFPNDLQRQANMIRGSLQGETEPGAYSGIIHPPLEENGMASGGLIGKLSKAAKAANKVMPTARIGLEAPGILIPSKVSNVKEAVRQSKGDFGARRVERAADEIPNLEQMYREEALRQAFTGDNAKGLMTINPADFERYATPLMPREKPWPGTGPKKENLPTDEYVNYLAGIDEYHDVPFLEINKQEYGLPLVPFISGHEGRHRNRAMAKRGEKAGLVQLLPRSELREPFPRRSQEEYLQALRDEMEMTGNVVVPQPNIFTPSASERPAIDLPDIYAKGGEVNGLRNALNNLLRTDKPEVHMGLGGAAAKVAAKPAKAAKKVEHPLVFPRAVPKSLEDIRPIAQRIAEQMTGDFVKQNPKLTTNPAGKSRKQFEREQNIPLETRNVVPERAAPDVNYEDYMGYGVVGVPGDPTLGGVAKRGSLEEVAQPTVELTRVGDITPDYPVPLFGGPRYGDDEKFWSSNFGAAVPIQKNASKLADEYQSPIIAKYIKMGSGSENFALHNLDALLAIQRPERLDKDKMARLTEVIQAGSPKYGKFPGFTGFEEPIDVLLQAQMDSNLRKHIAETLTKPTITNELGLANGLDVVAAITHPELRNLETGASGFSVGKMKPSAKLQRGESFHPTYDTDIPGSFLGRSKYPTPYEIAFPDTTAYARSRMTPGVQEFNMLKMLGPRERIDQQYIDEIKMYEELMKKYTGKKKGGLAQIKKVKRHGNTVPH